MTYVGKRELLSMKRRQSLISQMKLAAQIGMAQSQYSNIENGYAQPSKEQAEALIKMFDLPTDYFEIGDSNEDDDSQRT